MEKLIGNTCLILLLLLIMGCSGNSSSTGAKVDSINNGVTKTDGSDKMASAAEGPIDTIRFLKDSLKWGDVGCGGLMGLEPKRGDSTSCFCFANYYDKPASYEVVFLYKGGVQKRVIIGNSAIAANFSVARGTTYADFDAYAFIVPMLDPQKMPDMHALNYEFPASVRAYRRTTGDRWIFLWEKKVKNYARYRVLQFNTVYGIQ